MQAPDDSAAGFVTGTPDAWRRVATAIDARMNALGMSQSDLVRAADVSDPTIRNLQRARQLRYRRPKLVRVSRGLGWAPNAIEEILAGRSPREAVTPGLDDESMAAITEVLHRLDRMEQRLLVVEDRVGRPVNPG